MAHASSAELPRYGLSVGLKNYAAAYCTGLLVARRLLTKLGLAEVYEGTLTYSEEGDDDDDEYTPEVVSTEYNKRTYFVEELDEDKNPFRALLDVGIITTSTGSRIFGALKGATDGGLDIPHSEKRFPGYDRDAKEYDADIHKERIFGEHVAEYMRYLIEEDGAKYKVQFKDYIENEHEPDDLEELYQDVHKAIRADPKPAEKKPWSGDKTEYKRPAKKSYEQRKADMEAKRSKFEESSDEEDDEEDDE
jgi:large subunit ribosomal protein L5e